MASTQCSECDEEIEVTGHTRLGQKIVCNHCGAQLEVVAIAPLEVEIASEEDDSLWDDEEDELDELEEKDDDDEDDDLEEIEIELEIEEEVDDELDDDFDDDDFEDDDDDFEDDDDDSDDDDRWG